MPFSLFGKSPDLRKLAAQAEAAAAEGRAAEAEQLLREITRRNLDLENEENHRILSQAFLDLGEICEARNAGVEAFEHYQRARLLGRPLHAAAWATLAHGYAAAESKTGSALAAYLSYVHGHPPDDTNTGIYSTLEAACRVDESKTSDQRKQAFGLNQRVAAASPNLDWPYYYMAVALLMDGDLTSALTNLTAARKLNPNRAMTYYWLGACHLQQSGGSLQEAIDALSKFLAFPADSPQIVKRQRKAALELGRAYLKAGKLEQSRQTLAQATITHPDFGEAHDLLAQVCARLEQPRPSASEVERGNEALRAGDIAAAGESYDAALEKEPSSPDALYAMGRLAYRMEEMEVAADYFSKILADHPDHPRAQLALGVVHCRRGRHREALQTLEPLYRAGSESDPILASLGKSLASVERHSDAIQVWTKLLARHPEDKKLAANIFGIECLLNYRRALEYLRDRRFDNAIDLLRYLPEDARILYHLGLSHLLKGEPEEAIPLLERAAAFDTDVYGRYAAWAIANHHSGQHRYDVAAATLEQLRPMITPRPAYPGLRALAFHAALRQADAKATQHDWNRVVAELASALQADPPDPADARELERFAFILPVSQVQAGARRDAAETWERELKTHPGNREPLHNLAILYYWWALHEEALGSPGVDRLWAAAIAYWTLIVSSDQFWQAWKVEAEQRWGLELQDGDLRQMRSTFFDEQFTRVFQNFSSSYREKNRPADAQRHDDYLTMALLEKQSAAEWSATGAGFPAGGFLYCRQIGVLPDVLEEIDRLPEARQHKLKIYFSPARLGEILILIEDQRQPEKALERLAGLPDKLRQTPDAKYLRARALFESAQDLHKSDSVASALERVETAFSVAQFLEPQWSPLKQSIAGLFDVLAKLEATRLRQDNRLDDAIHLLDRLYAMSLHPEIREYLCILCCDRGFQKLDEKEFEGARAYFLQALELDAAYVRAGQAMCIALNNEALTKLDQEVKLEMLQRALEYNPHDQHVRENLGMVFHEKALKIARAASRENAPLELGRAIGLLRVAAMTVNPAVSEKWLTEFIASGGQRFQDEIEKMPADFYRTVLESLSQIARQRTARKN